MSSSLDFSSAHPFVEVENSADERRYKICTNVSSPSIPSSASASTLTPNPDIPHTPHAGQSVDFQNLSDMTHPAAAAPFFEDHTAQAFHHYSYGAYDGVSGLQLSTGHHDDLLGTSGLEARHFWDPSKQESPHSWQFSPGSQQHFENGHHYYHHHPQSAVTSTPAGDIARHLAGPFSPRSRPPTGVSHSRDEVDTGHWSGTMQFQSHHKDSVNPHDIQRYPEKYELVGTVAHHVDHPEPMRQHTTGSLPLLHPSSADMVDNGQESPDPMSDENDAAFQDTTRNLSPFNADRGTDSDYFPGKASKNDKRTPKKSNNGRAVVPKANRGRRPGTPAGGSTTSPPQPTHKVSKTRLSSGQKPANKQDLLIQSSSQQHLRPFTCPLSPYGCPKTFTSKNEWKRHISSQHICLGFWRCNLCADASGPNDFNRKDLFTQHVRRMHMGSRPTKKRDTGKPKSKIEAHTHCPKNTKNRTGSDPTDNYERQNSEQADLIEIMHTSCWKQVRTHPARLACYFCPAAKSPSNNIPGGCGQYQDQGPQEPGETFHGRGSYETWMEHVACHLSAIAIKTLASTSAELNAPKESPDAIIAAAEKHFDASTRVFARDTMLKAWLIREGVIEVNLRNSSGDLADSESVEDSEADGSSDDEDEDDGDDDKHHLAVNGGGRNARKDSSIRYSLIDRGLASDRAYRRKVSGTPISPSSNVLSNGRAMKSEDHGTGPIGRGYSSNGLNLALVDEDGSTDDDDRDADGDVDML